MLEYCRRYGVPQNHRWTKGKDRETFALPNGDLIVFNPSKTVYLIYHKLGGQLVVNSST